jgi:hypothetical protein
VWRHGEQCQGVDVRPGESCSSRGVVARPVPEQEQLRGWWCSGWLSGRCPWAGLRGLSKGARTRYNGRYGDILSPCAPTASGMSLQYAAWRYSDGDGRTGLTATGWPLPPARRHDVALCSHGKSIRGFRRPTFEGSARYPYKGRRHSVAGLTPASPHSVTQWRGWPAPRRSVEQHRSVIPRRVRVVAQSRGVRSQRSTQQIRIPMQK